MSTCECGMQLERITGSHLEGHEHRIRTTIKDHHSAGRTELMINRAGLDAQANWLRRALDWDACSAKTAVKWHPGTRGMKGKETYGYFMTPRAYDLLAFVLRQVQLSKTIKSRIVFLDDVQARAGARWPAVLAMLEQGLHLQPSYKGAPIQDVIAEWITGLEAA